MVIGFVDWGEDEHQIGFIDQENNEIRQLRVSNTAKGMTELMDAVWEVAPELDLRVGIERPDGAIVDTLLEQGIDVFSINPKQLDRYRDFLRVSGAKDDVFDCYVGARALKDAPDAFRRLSPVDPLIAELREMVRHRQELLKEIGRVLNRLRAQLSRTYPQFKELLSNSSLRAAWIRRLLKVAPTPAEAQSLTLTEVKEACRCQRGRNPEEILSILQSESFKVPSGILNGARIRIESYLSELEVLLERLKVCESREEELIEQWGAQQEPVDGFTDLEIMRSMPCSTTRILAPRIAFGADAILQRDAKLLSKQSGSVPVSVLSGKQQNKSHPQKKPTVHRRLACNRHLRDAAFYLGDASFKWDPFYKSKYALGRARGHTHGRACRDIAVHYDRVMMSCLKSREPYDVKRLLLP